MQNPVTREEFFHHFEKLETKLDNNTETMHDCLGEIKKSLTELHTRHDLLEIPTIPDRPCPFFLEHQAEHQKQKDGWRKPIVVGVVVTMLMFIQEPLRVLLSRMIEP